MTKDVKEALNTCGRNMALITEENCLEILYLAREEILQEIIMGMIDSLKDDSEAIYEIFFRSNNTIVKLKALEKIHNQFFLKAIVLGEYVHGRDLVRMKSIGKIENISSNILFIAFVTSLLSFILTPEFSINSLK